MKASAQCLTDKVDELDEEIKRLRQRLAEKDRDLQQQARLISHKDAAHEKLKAEYKELLHQLEDAADAAGHMAAVGSRFTRVLRSVHPTLEIGFGSFALLIALFLWVAHGGTSAMVWSLSMGMVVAGYYFLMTNLYRPPGRNATALSSFPKFSILASQLQDESFQPISPRSANRK